MKDQRVLIQHLRKYKQTGFRNFLFDFLKNDVKRYQETFTKNGCFKVVNDNLFTKDGQFYGRYVNTVSIDQLAKDLGM